MLTKRNSIPLFLILLGVIMIIASNDKYNIIDEEVVVPAEGFIETIVNPIPGASIEVSLEQNTDHNIYLLVMILDDYNYIKYSSTSNASISGTKLKYPLLGSKIYYVAPFSSSCHIILDNIHLVDNRYIEKPIHIIVDIKRSYYLIPGIMLLGIGLIIFLLSNKKYLLFSQDDHGEAGHSLLVHLLNEDSLAFLRQPEPSSMIGQLPRSLFYPRNMPNHAVYHTPQGPRSPEK